MSVKGDGVKEILSTPAPKLLPKSAIPSSHTGSVEMCRGNMQYISAGDCSLTVSTLCVLFLNSTRPGVCGDGVSIVLGWLDSTQLPG